jgi:hypothetical protein
MMRRPGLALIGLALAIAGCNSGEKANAGSDDKGTDISLNVTDEDGPGVTASADGNTGQVAIKVPGFEGKINLPKIALDSGNFNLNGAKLYPGSKIRQFAINGKGHEEGGNARFSFDAPADPAKVKAWFETELTKAKFRVTPKGSGLAGTNEDGDDFTLELTPGAAGHTAGTMTVG